mmetsp:Transcript_6062/g.14985  ORF Transcript_6062/g.14985 Transcript_6062/m.14985 type:complete len:783 (-) Transcript_6062:74-2422(-)
MPAQCLSIVAWSCASLRLCHEALLADIEKISAPRLNELKPFELSNLLWAYSKLSLSPRDLSKATAGRMLKRKDGEFKVQCLATIAWAFATMRQRNAPLFSSLAKELAARAEDMKPQEISNTLWAYAKAGAGQGGRCQHSALFYALGHAALSGKFLLQFKAQELSNMVWAFATIGLPMPELFTSVEAVVVSRSRELAPQHVANILWAFARVQAETHYDMFTPLLDMAIASRSSYKPQELTALVWAASQMCPNSSVFGPLARECASRLQQFSSSALVNLVSVFASLDVTAAPEALAQMVVGSLTRLSEMEPPMRGKLLRAAAEGAAQLPPGLYERLEAQIADVTPAGVDIHAASASDQSAGGFSFQVWAPAAAKTSTKLQKSNYSMSSTSAGSSADDDEDARWPIEGDGEVTTPPPSPILPTSPAKVQMPKAILAPPGLGHVFSPSSGSDVGTTAAPIAGVPWTLPVPVQFDAPSSVLSPLSTMLSPEAAITLDVAKEGAPSNVLRVVHASCLSEQEETSPSGPTAWIRQGLTDEHVMLRRVPEEACPVVSATVNGIFGSSYVLRPIARVSNTALAGGYAILAYPRTAHGSLKEWLAKRQAVGQQVTAAESARVAHGVLLAAAALLESGMEVLSTVHPDEIFIGDNEEPLLREPLPGATGIWNDNLRWFSPEEAACDAGVGAGTIDAAWPSLAHRIGLLLYCLGSGTTLDPYPEQSGEDVLMNVLREAREQCLPVRPDMTRWQGPSILRQLVAALLRVGGQPQPARPIVAALLETLKGTKVATN